MKQKKNKIVKWKGEYKIASFPIGEFSTQADFERDTQRITAEHGDMITDNLITGRMFYVTEVKDGEVFGYYLN